MTESEIAQQYCVRWNSHLPSLSTAFPQLLNQQRFIDVTLACEGQQVHCHKMVLAACSTYFDALLSENPCKHPIIILPKDIKFWTVQALVEFMYKGQVNVSQAGLPDLVKTGDLLQIRGLCNTDITSGLTTSSSSTSSTPPASAGSGTNCQNIESCSSKNGKNPDHPQAQKGEGGRKISSTTKNDETYSMADQLIDDSDKMDKDDPDYDDQLEIDESKDRSLDYAMANVMVEYEYEGSEREYMNDSADYDDNPSGRRIRRPEATLQEAAEFVSSGETFQKVSTLFNIPISTIRFYMARKGILPRRKRGRTTLTGNTPNSTTITSTTSFFEPSGSSYHIDGHHSNSTFEAANILSTLSSQNHSRSSSPSLDPQPYHLANKLPEVRPKLM